MTLQPDPFKDARAAGPTLPVEVNGETLPLLLRLQDVRRACKKTADYSSANPFHITLGSEAALRSFRQFPIETDPPEHTEYRAIVEPLFQRPNQPEYAAAMRRLVESAVAESLEQGEVDIVHGLALPLQSRALTLLLGLPESEAELWISWGLNVFKDDQGNLRGETLEAYTAERLARAKLEPGDDFFSVLQQARFRGRPLSYEEKQGFANLVFAGGRDTVIYTTTAVFAEVAEDPGLLGRLASDPERVAPAVEEVVRITSPLTALSRTCPRDTEFQEEGGRVGLCWASANRDERFFQDPDRFQADRAPNPHVGFGFGAHACLGSTHARLLLRMVFTVLAEQKVVVTLRHATPNVETYGKVKRQAGFKEFRVQLRTG